MDAAVFAEYVASLVSYDPDTGVFLWKERIPDRLGWNGRHAGNSVGTKDKNGYSTLVASYSGRSKAIKLHRLAWFMVNGSLPDGDIDHINHDRADNRIANLRCVSRSTNHRNMTRSTRNTSGVVGVSRSNRKGLPWRARFFHENREVRVGYFASVEEAEAALRIARSAHGYHENHGAEA